MKHKIIIIIFILFILILQLLYLNKSDSKINNHDYVYKTLSCMAFEREHYSTVLLKDGNILITGGYNNRRDSLKAAEIYNPKINKSTIISDMNVERSHHSSFLLDNGNVLIVGGDNTAEIYDIKRNKFILKNLKIYYFPGPNIFRTKDNSVVITGDKADIQIFNEKTSEFEIYKYQIPIDDKNENEYLAFQNDDKEIYLIPSRDSKNQNILKFTSKDLPIETLNYNAEELNNFGMPVIMLPGNKLLLSKKYKKMNDKEQFAILDIKTGIINKTSEINAQYEGNIFTEAVKLNNDNIYIISSYFHVGAAKFIPLMKKAESGTYTSIYNISENKFISIDNPKINKIGHSNIFTNIGNGKIFIKNGFKEKPQLFYKNGE